MLAHARYGALSAPQGNRCYLPSEGAALIPALLSRFAGEFAEQLRQPERAAAAVPIPKIVDWDETSRNFVLDERQQSKRPDWTYEPPHAPPHAPSRPAALPHDRGHMGVPLPSELIAALRSRAERDAVAIETLVERALKEWLQKHRS